MGSFSIWHWLVVLLVIILVFGTSKLKNMGKDLGGAIKGFKEGIKEARALFEGPSGFTGAFERLRRLEAEHNVAVPAQLSPSGPFWADINPKYQDLTVSA